nr:Mucin-16 like [Ipomoea batatas]
MQANYQRASKGISVQKALQLACPSQKVWLRRDVKETKWNFNLLVANTDRVETDSLNSSVENPSPSSESSRTETEDQPSARADSAPEGSDGSNGLLTSKNLKEDVSSVTTKPALKRSPLTAREKLRAARVLSRYNNESKAASKKPDMGSKLLEVLRESEKGKKGLPEAPNNLFDDSKRGLPKPGWTFELPVGFDVFLIAFSFVFISTVMFATTYIVWKVGAIHFNEY